MTDPRADIQGALAALLTAPEADLKDVARQALTPDTDWQVSHPFAPLRGPEAVVEGYILPLRRALGHARRRDEIFIGGPNRRAEGGDWVAAVSHTVGTFAAPFCGVAPCGKLVFLRMGEFYRIEHGRIAQARIIVDLADLMRQAGAPPFPPMLGTEMLFPGPATHDGVRPANRGNGTATLDRVEAMLADLHAYDPVTGTSARQTGTDGHWHDDMLWYGPGGIGASYRWDGFVNDHRAAFLHAFPDRKGGNHYCRIGDGNYAAVSGWPSMTMTHTGDYLGVPATGKSLTLRVMDFYRCDGGQIMENWVLLDYADLFAQMGADFLRPAA